MSKTMRIDTELFKEIAYRNINRFDSRRQFKAKEIVAEYKEITGYEMTKGQYDRTVRNLRAEEVKERNRNKDEVRKEDVKKEDRHTIKRNSDGSILYDKVIQLHENDINDDVAILKAFSLSSEIWEIVDVIFNLWSVESLEKRLNNYQCKLRVRKKNPNEKTPEDIAKLFEKMEPIGLRPYRTIDSGKQFALFLADEHIGSPDFSSERFMQMVKTARKDILERDIEKVHINLLGDLLHVDNTLNSTVKGTPQGIKTDGFDMVDEAIQLIITLIYELSVVPTEVHWVQGNHSRLLEYTTMLAIKNYFKDNKQIKFHVGKERDHGYKIYDTGIFLHHGDMPKKNIYDWIHFKYSAMWGECTAWELHTGHFHEKDVNTVGGLSHTQHGIKLKAGEFAQSLGYGNYWLKCEAYIYEKVFGSKTTERY